MRRGLIFFIIALVVISVGVGYSPKIIKPIKLVSGEINSVSVELYTPGIYLLQLKSTINKDIRAELQDLGVKFYSYIPVNTYLVKITHGFDEIAGKDYVDYLGKYKAEHKRNKAKNDNAMVSTLQDSKKVKYEVSVFDTDEREETRSKIEDMGGEILESKGKYIVVEIDDTMVDSIASIGAVEWLGEKLIPEIHNEPAREPMGIYPVTIRGLNLSGAGQTIAVADTGVDTGLNDTTMHDDFEGRIGALYNWAGSNASDLSSGHGTHVAGSALGNGSKSEGNLSGVAPNATLIFQAIGDDAGDLTGIPTDLKDLFVQAYNASARIHTNSWGYTSGGNPVTSYHADNVEADEYIYNTSEILVIFSAGNSGANANTVSAPGNAKNILSVGSSENNRSTKSAGTGCGTVTADNVNEVPCFSSRGPTDDNRIKPDVVAPGSFVLSTKSSLLGANPLSWGAYDDFYSYSSGTSMSAPLVAGLAALVREYFVNNQSVTPSGALLKAAIINGAEDIGYGMPSNETGWGRVNLTATIDPPNPLSIRYHDNSSGLENTESFNVSYSINNNTTKLKITLVWSDYPSTTIAATNLVNDLDLIVFSPNGTIYNGNDFIKPNNDFKDSINNVEQVIINSSEIGTYNITVNNSALNSGDNQTFALFLSGAIGAPTISFVNPTRADAIKTTENYTYVNITSSVPLDNAILEWNYTKNISMGGSGTNFFHNISSNTSLISFKVYGNITNLIGESETRIVEMNNTAPKAENILPGNYTPKMNESETLFFNITKNDTDLANVGMTWYLDGVNVSSEDNYTYSPSYNSSGDYNITFNLSDGFLDNVTYFNLTVLNVNVLPEIVSQIPGNIRPNITEVDNQTFNITINELDNDSYSVNWTLDGVDVSAELNYTFVGNYSSNDSYNVTMYLNDSLNNTSITWNLTVSNVNRAPNVSVISNITVNESDLIDINASGELNPNDEDGENLTITYSSLLNSSGQYQTNNQSSGQYNITVTVTDGIDNTSRNVTITVLDVADVDNDGLNNSEDNVEGNSSSVGSITINVNVTINGTTNFSNRTFTGLQNVSIKNGGDDIVTFVFNFTGRTLNLSAITIEKQTGNTFGSILIKGFERLNLSKSVYLDNRSNESYVCLEDATITSIDNISGACTGTDEFLLPCDGAGSSGYNCSVSGVRYLIQGVNNSGIKQQCGDGDGDGYGTNCVLGTDCNDNDAGTNSGCSTSTSGGSSGGGGGGGGSTATITSISVLAVGQKFSIKKGDSLSFVLGSETHSIKVFAIIGDTITLRFSSVSFDVDFINGETKMIDINSDGKDDLQVKVVKTAGSSVDVYIKDAIIATCSDGIRNQNEIFTDCGGPCDPCEVPELVNEAKNEDLLIEASIPNFTSTSVAETPIVEVQQGKAKTYWIFAVIIIAVGGYLFRRRIEQGILYEMEQFKVHKVHEELNHLEKYIQHAMFKGVSEKKIRKRLGRIGWGNDVIDNSFETVEIIKELKKHGVLNPPQELHKMANFVEEQFGKNRSEEEILGTLRSRGWEKNVVRHVITNYDIVQELKAHKVHYKHHEVNYLDNYIGFALDKGHDEKAVKDSLHHAGWSKHVVHKVYKNKKVHKELKDHGVHEVHGDLNALHKYIKHAITKGRSKSEIRRILNGVGWKDENIEAGF